MTQMQQVGTPEKQVPGHWIVPSGKFGYHVRWVSGRYTCCCSAHRFRPDLACKHIVAVRRMKQEVPMG
jgi:hypothetical protein